MDLKKNIVFIIRGFTPLINLYILYLNHQHLKCCEIKQWDYCDFSWIKLQEIQLII